jgi:phosphoglycerol transferase MdoB-like AlkP superfamily enzyme
MTLDFGASAGGYFYNIDFVMLIDLLLLFYVTRKSKKLSKNQQPLVKKESLTKKSLLFVTSFTFSFLIMITQFFAVRQTIGMETYQNYALLLSPVGNHLVNMASFVSEKVKTLSEEDSLNIKAWFAANEKNLDADPQYEDLYGILEGKNIIVIHYESLEKFVLDSSFYGKEITPNLNKILDSSISFTVQEQVREGTSSDTELMFNTGLYPTLKGSAFMSYGENTYFSLPKLLKEDGYETMTIHGDEAKFWNRDVVYPNIGIDKYVDESLFEDKRYSGLGILDESLFTQSLKEIEKTDSPFYAYIMSVTSHTPFNIEEEYRFLGIPGEDADAGYLESMHYTDHYLGEFYDSLEEKGILEDSAIIIFGDHEGIHKYHESSLPENNGEIPFIVSIPGMEGFEVDQVGGQIDMLPTLLYLLGVEKDVYSGSVMGSNLLSSDSGSVILPTGEILGETLDEEHLIKASEIANLIITGNYFGEDPLSRGRQFDANIGRSR